jgi:ABC-type dipeptide/oligopeptide/nickel transport system ATPase subunit
MILCANAVTKTYGKKDTQVDVLTELSLELAAGETVGLVGPSGAEKVRLAVFLRAWKNPTPEKSCIRERTFLQ